MATASNVTALTSPQDIFMAFPRIIARAGSFAFITVPEKIDNILGFGNGGSMIAEATGNGSRNILSAAMSGGSGGGGTSQTSGAASSAAMAAGSTLTSDGENRGFGLMTFRQIRNFGGIFAYMTSRWALACCTLVSVQLVTHPVTHILDRSC